MAVQMLLIPVGNRSRLGLRRRVESVESGDKVKSMNVISDMSFVQVHSATRAFVCLLYEPKSIYNTKNSSFIYKTSTVVESTTILQDMHIQGTVLSLM